VLSFVNTVGGTVKVKLPISLETSSTKYKDGLCFFCIIAVYCTSLEAGVVEPMVRYPCVVSNDGRQYEKVAPNVAAACEDSDSAPRPRPTRPSTPPNSPRFLWPHPNANPGSACVEVSDSVSWDRTPAVDEPSPYSTL